ncbi:hypothetical protein CAL7716_085380 [Calothrix sp. PCC 7716]|nr:hypothetical protein CAL7716_085380 [Calothrix sp. PCC 7716]
MTSPFAQFKNAELLFKVPDGTYTTNSAGNRISGTKILKIEALLKQSKDKGDLAKYAKDIEAFAGADSYAFLLEGYLVAPTIYPTELEFLTEADATVTLLAGLPKQGRFKLLPVVDSPYLIATEINLTTPIKGIFRVN